MRLLPRLLTAAAALTFVPAVVAWPTITPPAPKPHRVHPTIRTFTPSADEVIRPHADAQAMIGPRSPVVYTDQRTAKPFDLVAVTWRGSEHPGGAEPQIRVRVHEGGRWSDWELLDSSDGPDANTAEGRAAQALAGSEPLLTTGADGVQVRVDDEDGRVPEGLRVDLVDPGSSPADAHLAPQPPPSSASASTSKPAIITRAQWGADESLRKGTTVVNSHVRALFLHHTDGVNTYTRAQAAAQVRAVYAYHTRVRGWNDIGYNFLVDRFGRIFEGRAGSIDQAVLGAHTGGFNTDTMGISAIGNYDVARPPAALIRGVEKIMAWKAAQYEINPLGSVTLTSSGGGTSRYAAGKRVRIRTISGHRDVGRTACPGRYLYPKLPGIRSALAKLMRPGLSAPSVHPTSVLYGGGPITFSARIPTTQRWTMTVTAMCPAATVRTFSGRSASAVQTDWDLLDSTGTAVPPGVYTIHVTTRSPVGAGPSFTRDVEVLPTAGAPASSCPTQRFMTGDVYAATVAAGQLAAPGGTDVVIALAAARSVDALVAAPLARFRSAPLLLSSRTGLPQATVDEIVRRAPSRAWIVGGTAAVPQSVEAQLQALGVGTVTRLAGTTRYATAAAVAAVMTPTTRAFLVSGADQANPDLLATAGTAAALARPILLSSATGLPSVTGTALQNLGVTRVDVVGTGVPAAAVQRLPAYGVTSVARRSGPDRNATAAAVATAYSSVAATGGAVVVPGADERFADALVGIALGRVTVFTDRTTLPASSAGFLTAARPATVLVIGGTGSVATITLHNIYRATQGTG